MYAELKKHIVELLDAGTRLDGRKLTEYRKPIEIEYGVVNTADGSARARIGETDVIVGVKLEVGVPYPDTPDEGSIMVGAELLPLSNPEFELGPPGIQAVELARVVDRAIREAKAIDFKKLCITPKEKAWIVVIDICTINDDGNLFDASSLAAIAALKDTKFPDYDGEKIDYTKHNDVLPLEFTSLSITVIKVGAHYFVDPNIEEERVVDARLTVGSLEDGTLCSLQKGGDSPLARKDIDKMIDIAVQKAKELRKFL